MSWGTRSLIGVHWAGRLDPRMHQWHLAGFLPGVLATVSGIFYVFLCFRAEKGAGVRGQEGGYVSLERGRGNYPLRVFKRCFPNGVFQIPRLGLRHRKTPFTGTENA